MGSFCSLCWAVVIYVCATVAFFLATLAFGLLMGVWALLSIPLWLYQAMEWFGEEGWIYLAVICI